MNFLKKIFGTFSTQLLMIFLGLANNAIIANLFGPAGQGSFAFLMLVPAVLVTVGNLGIGIANTYFTGSKKYDLSTLTNQSIFLAISLGGLLIIGFYLANSIFSFHADASLNLVIWVIPFSLTTLFIGQLFLGLNKTKYFNLVILSPKLSLFISIIIIFFIFHADINGICRAYLGAEIAAGLLVFLFLRRYLKPVKIRPVPRFSVIKRMITFGLQGFFGNVFIFLNYRLDMFLILYFIDRKALGLYSIAVLLVEKIWLIPNAIGLVLFPQVAADRDKQRFTPLICRNNLFITTLGAALLFFAAPWIIRLFFIDEYAASILPLRILIPGIVILGIQKVLSADLAGRGKPIYATIASGIALILNFGLNLYLLPQMGISGAALASTISYSLSAVCMIYLYKRQTHVSLSQLLLLQKEDIAFYRAFIRRLLER